MKEFFGFLFLLLAVILAIVQVSLFVQYGRMSGGRLFLMSCLTVGSVGLASLVYVGKIKALPAMSDKRIARIMGCDAKEVNEIRRDVIASGALHSHEADKNGEDEI